MSWRKECGESLANVWAGKEAEGVDEGLIAISLEGFEGDSRDFGGGLIGVLC